MGTAGLDIKRLAGLLKRKKVECSLINGDAALDHCVLQLSSVRRPSVLAFLEYENHGTEFRVAGIVFRDERFTPQRGDYPLEWQATLRLEGARKDDANKIAQWVEREFISSSPHKLRSR